MSASAAKNSSNYPYLLKNLQSLPRVLRLTQDIKIGPAAASACDNSSSMATQRNSWMFVDCQGLKSCGTEGSDVLFEICWKLLSESEALDGFCAGTIPGAATVVRPAIILGRSSLARITRLCGIRPVELARAPDIDEVASAFANAIEDHQPAGIVIHYAVFERPFLSILWALARPGVEFPVPVICTHDLARKQLPELNSYSLKAVAGYFGAPCDEMKRAEAHVDATIAIWRGLQCLDRESGRPGKELRSLRLALPDVPGTYRFFDARGRVLYVGKATSLHHRVNSYFRGGVRDDSRKREMMAQVKNIEVFPAPSPLHAALDEFRSIIDLSPPYNIAMNKDDRPVVWLDRESLLPVSSAGETGRVFRVLGPFASDSVFNDLRSLSAIYRGEEPEKPIEFMFPGLDPHDEILHEALDRVVALTGIPEASFGRPFAWLSAAVLRFLRNADHDESLEDPRGESRDELPWDVECVTRSILRKLKRAATTWSQMASVRLLCGAEVTIARGGEGSGTLSEAIPVAGPATLGSIHQLQEAALILSGIKAAGKEGSMVQVKRVSGRLIVTGRRGITSRILFTNR